MVWLPAASAFARLSGQNFNVSGTLCLREVEDTHAVRRQLKMRTERREEEKELRSTVVYPTNNVLETETHKPQICRAAKPNT